MLCAKTVLGSLLIVLTATPSGGQTFEERSSVVVVEVPVQVLVGGRPVRGLAKKNFELYDNGQLEEITGFDVLDLSSAPSRETELKRGAPGPGEPPAALRRNFLFIIDFAYPGSWDRVSGAGSITAAVHRMADASERVTGLLDESFHQSDRLAIAYLSPLRGFKLLQGWTSDRDQALGALGLLSAASEIEPEKVRELWTEWAPGRAATSPDAEGESLWATVEDLTAEARTAGARGDPSLPHLEVAEEFIDGVIAARRELGEPPGPRHVVYLSTGFPIESLQDLQRLFREFRRTHWTIQTVNTGGLGFGADSLFLLAYETGGQLFTNSNHVDVLLTDMAEETAVTYVLSFQAEGGRAEGAFHKLRVRLVDGPARARLVHRRAYYSPGTEDEQGSSP